LSLQAPNLDDRRFQDIVDETKLLIPKYCPEWTSHNLSDPGVALIELFAWMSDALLYRLNQVPERLYVKFLQLMGIAPYPPSPARAELTFWLSTVLSHPVTVPKGTQVGAPELANPPITFETTEELVIAPPKLMAAKTGHGSTGTTDLVDVWDDLCFGRPGLRCFPSQPAPAPGDALYLGFANSLAGSVVRLRLRATSPAGIGIYPSRPPLTWEAWSGEAWVTVPVHSDTTGGLNRDGDVVLLLPLSHAALTLGTTRAYWVRVVLTSTVPGQPTYQASPLLNSVSAETLGGTAPAEHSARCGPESLGRSNGLPGQAFRLAHPPVLPRRDDEVLEVVTEGLTQAWQEVEDFSASAPTDRHYVLDSVTGEVQFGPRVRYPDGSWRQHGAVPPPGCEVIMPAYRHGGGAVGNVGPGVLTSLRSTVAFIDRVSNLKPAGGGADAEPVSEAKRRAPLTLRTSQRAVTPGDFERLASEASPEVARTRCLAPSLPGSPVRLLIVPKVRRSPELQEIDDYALSDGLVETISDFLEPRRLVGTTIEVAAPYYQGVTVAAHLRAAPTASDQLLARARADALRALYAWLNPLCGGPNGDGWPWGANLNAAPIAELLERVPGVERVDEVLLFECDLRTGRRYGEGKQVLGLDEASLFLSTPQPRPLPDGSGSAARTAAPSHAVVVVR
jgi:predicted phage baseplate assembly protein